MKLGAYCSKMYWCLKKNVFHVIHVGWEFFFE